MEGDRMLELWKQMQETEQRYIFLQEQALDLRLGAIKSIGVDPLEETQLVLNKANAKACGDILKLKDSIENLIASEVSLEKVLMKLEDGRVRLTRAFEHIEKIEVDLEQFHEECNQRMKALARQAKTHETRSYS